MNKYTLKVTMNKYISTTAVRLFWNVKHKYGALNLKHGKAN